MNISSLVFNNDLAGLIITLAAQSILISLFGITILKLLRKRSAPVRSLVCTCAIGILGLAVIASAGFRLSGISWFGTVITAADLNDMPLINSHLQSSEISRSITETGLKPVSTGEVSDLGPVSTTLADRTDIIESPDAIRIAPLLISLINSFGIIWLIGMLYLLIRLGYGFVLVNKFRKNLIPVTDIFYIEMARSTSGVFWNNRIPDLYRSEDIESPVTIGLFRPVTVIPDKLFDSLSEYELKSILLHEFSHIYHYDQFMGAIKRIVLAFHWWNPIVHIINRMHEQAREEVSDNYVLREVHPRIYTRCLANLAEKVCLISNLPAASCMAGRNFNLHKRVEQILSTKRSIAMNTKLYLKAVIFSVGLVLTLGVAGLHGKVESETFADDPEIMTTMDRNPLVEEVNRLLPEITEEQAQNSTESISNDTKTFKTVSQDKQEIKVKNTGTVITGSQSGNSISKKRARPENTQEAERTVSGRDIQAAHNAVKNQKLVESKINNTKKETPILFANLEKKISAKDNNKTESKGPDQKQHKKLADTAEQKHYTADDYFPMGKIWLKKGEPEKAVSNFSRAIESGKKTAELYLFRGNAYTDINKQEKAIDDYSKAIELNPDYADAYNNRGSIFFTMQEYKKAIKDFKKAIKIKSDFYNAYYNRGNTYFEQRKYRRAISDYSKAIKINPGFFSAYLKRGNVYLKNSSYRKAILDYTKALELKKDADVYFLRGYTYRASSKYENAINDFTRAIEINPDHADSYFYRGIVYAWTNQRTKAKQDFIKVKEINPKILSLAFTNINTMYNAHKTIQRTAYLKERFRQHSDLKDAERSIDEVSPPFDNPKETERSIRNDENRLKYSTMTHDDYFDFIKSLTDELEIQKPDFK